MLVLALVSAAWITISVFDWNKLASEADTVATSNEKDIKFLCNDISPHQPPLQATKGDKSSWDTFKNDACRCLCTNFILFVTSVNSFIPRRPKSMLCRRRDLWSVSTLLSLIVVSVQYREYDLIKVTRSNANIPTPAPNPILVHRRLPLSILLGFPNCSVRWITFHLLSVEGKRLQQSFQHPTTDSIEQRSSGQRESKCYN